MLEENKGWKAPSTSAGTAATKAPASCCCGSLGCGWDTVLWPMPSRGAQASEGTQGWMRGWPQGPTASLSGIAPAPCSVSPPCLVAIVISNITQGCERLEVASFPARLNRSLGMSIIPTSQLSPPRYVSGVRAGTT